MDFDWGVYKMRNNKSFNEGIEYEMISYYKTFYLFMGWGLIIGSIIFLFTQKPVYISIILFVLGCLSLSFYLQKKQELKKLGVEYD
jgi:hypothetical protein